MNDQPVTEKTKRRLAWPVIAKFQDKVTDISWSIFSVGFLSSLLSIGYEAFVWLKTGESADLRFFSDVRLAEYRHFHTATRHRMARHKKDSCVVS